MLAQFALSGDVGRDRSDGDVSGHDLDERPVGVGIGGIEEIVVIEVVAPRGFALVIGPGKESEGLRDVVKVSSAHPAHSAPFTLTDQAEAEVGEKREIVGAEEAGELQLLVSATLPHIVCGNERRVRLVLLPWVDGVRVLNKA